MGCLRTLFCGRDPDDVLAYGTVKNVIVRDRYLGCLYYSLLVVVIGYVVGFVVLFEQRYLLRENPSGSLRLLLDGSTRDTSHLPYCQTAPCRIWDMHDVRYPNSDSSTLIATTFVKESHQTRRPQCNITSSSCPFPSPFETTSVASFFVAGLENYTLDISHSVESPNFYAETRQDKFRGVSRDMVGRLVRRVDGHTQVVKTFDTDPTDRLQIFELLELAGVTLNDTLPGEEETIRTTGCVLFAHIHYSNTYKFFAPARHIEYSYEFLLGRDTEKVFVPIWGSDHYSQNRVLQERRGIKIVFFQEGSLGKFDTPTLLIAFVTALAILSVANFLTDIVATSVMPMRKHYEKAMFEYTDDYSDIRNTKKEARVRRRLLQNKVDDHDEEGHPPEPAWQVSE